MTKQKGLIAALITAGILGLTGIGVYATGQIAQMNSISLETAQNFAFVDAGIAPEEATVIKSGFDYENGKFVYEIDFYTDTVKYDYVVEAATGRILEKEEELRPGAAEKKTTTQAKTDGTAAGASNDATTPQAKPSATPRPTLTPAAPKQELIGIEKAKSIALADAGLSSSGVVFSKAKQDIEDGMTVYDVEFYVDGKEYEYEIDAVSGAIRERNHEIMDVEDILESTIVPQQGGTSNNAGNGGATPSVNTPATPQVQTVPQNTPAPQSTPSAPKATPAPQAVNTPAPQAAPAPAPVIVYNDDDDDWDDDDWDDDDDDRYDDWDDDDDDDDD